MVRATAMKLRYLPILILSASTLHAENADPELNSVRPQGTSEKGNFLIHAGWESRYVSEGRDNLDGAGLATGTLEAGWEWISLGAWYGNSPEVSYDELELSAALVHAWGDFEAYLAYAHIRQPIDGVHDNEIGLGAAWNGLPYDLFLAFDGYYSFDASGYFFEVTCGNDFEINECLTLSPSVTFGVNQGYISNSHDGANNIAASLLAEYAVTDFFAISAHAAYNFALDRDPFLPGDDLLRDFFHAGIGLNWSF